MIFLSTVLYLVDFYRITLSFTKWSRNLSWFKHYTTKQGNIFCWYFFLFWYIFWTCGIGMLFFISLEFVMGGEDQVRKKWHCCIYNITTIWIQIFHTSNSILGTLRFRKGVHNLTRIFLKWSSIYLLLLITIFLDQTLRVALLIVPTLDAQDIVGKKAFKKCKKETLDIIFHLRFVQAIVWYYFFHFKANLTFELLLFLSLTQLNIFMTIVWVCYANMYIVRLAKDISNK